MRPANHGEELVGRRALVVGAARGIGAACAKALASHGVWTACADIVVPDQTVADIEGDAGRAIPIRCDVSREKDVTRMFERTLEHVGRLDFLVHCAGVIDERPLLETPTEVFDRVMDVNLRGTFLVGREGIRAMRPRGGRVIVVSSDLGYLGRETFSPYAASKHGVMGLVRSWAREFAPDILVNAICPGPVDTEMLSAGNMTAEWRARELDIPLARLGAVEEIADMAVFLATRSSRFITGQGLHVNGGSVMP